MVAGTPELLTIAFFAALLLTACVTDWRGRTIPNWLTATVALAAPAHWWAAGLPLWPDIAIQAGIATLVFCVCAGFFALGAMGGGDVKLLGAVALWLPGILLVKMLIVMSILGGVLTLALLAWHRIRKYPGAPEIPYGLAIAAAGLWAIYERYLNHFG